MAHLLQEAPQDSQHARACSRSPTGRSTKMEGHQQQYLKKKMFQDRNFIRESQPCISLRTQPEVWCWAIPSAG